MGSGAMTGVTFIQRGLKGGGTGCRLHHRQQRASARS